MPISSLKRAAIRKAAVATARHSARGTASKLRHDRVRSLTLMGAGAMIGASAALLSRRLFPQAQAG